MSGEDQEKQEIRDCDEGATEWRLKLMYFGCVYLQN